MYINVGYKQPHNGGGRPPHVNKLSFHPLDILCNILGRVSRPPTVEVRKQLRLKLRFAIFSHLFNRDVKTRIHVR